MVALKCNNCGADLSETTRFCGICGTPVSVTAPASLSDTPTAVLPPVSPASPHFAVPVPVNKVFGITKFDFKNLTLKKFILPAIGAVIGLVAIFVAINILKPAQYEKYKSSIYITQSDESVIVIPNGKNKIEIDGYLVRGDGTKNLDGTKAVALISENRESYGSNSEGYSLYLITDKTQLIADDVYEYWFAVSGDAVAYVTDYDSSANLANLSLYSNGKITTVASDITYRSSYSSSDETCWISPDGKAVSYIMRDEKEVTGYVWNGKSHELGKDIYPVAVSNGAKYIYYKKNNSLYVQKGFNSDNREKLGENVRTIFANKDLTQVICENDSKAYISRNGGKREPLSGSISMLLTPSGTSYYHSSIVSVYGISNFANTFYRRDDGDIIRINGRYETDSIAKEVYEVYLAQDGNTLTYSRNENIYKVNGKKSKDDATQIVDGDVFTFLATIDGRAVYYINEDGEIFYQKGTGKSVSVTNDVTGFDFTLFKGKTFYYVSDDELYVSSGGKGKRVDGFNGEVKGVSGGMHTLSVTADDDGEILFYRSTDGKKFEILRQED